MMSGKHIHITDSLQLTKGAIWIRGEAVDEYAIMCWATKPAPVPALPFLKRLERRAQIRTRTGLSRRVQPAAAQPRTTRAPRVAGQHNNAVLGGIGAGNLREKNRARSN
jgi:hypothetical protein